MHILQYYTASLADKAKIIALAELLSCEYRTVENIITMQVNDPETLDRLRTGVPSINAPGGVLCSCRDVNVPV